MREGVLGRALSAGQTAMDHEPTTNKKTSGLSPISSNKNTWKSSKPPCFNRLVVTSSTIFLVVRDYYWISSKRFSTVFFWNPNVRNFQGKLNFTTGWRKKVALVVTELAFFLISMIDPRNLVFQIWPLCGVQKNPTWRMIDGIHTAGGRLSWPLQVEGHRAPINGENQWVALLIEVITPSIYN